MEPDVKPGDACAMIARCHLHQHPHEHGRPALPEVDPFSEEQMEIARAMFNVVPVDDTVFVPYDDGGWC